MTGQDYCVPLQGYILGQTVYNRQDRITISGQDYYIRTGLLLYDRITMLGQDY
jgi:hypothetical protein